MKKYLIIYMVLIVNILYGNSVILSEQEKSFLEKKQTITIGIGSGWEPSAMVSKDGKITGFDADILNEVNKATGANFVLKVGIWNDIQELAQKKEIDGLSSVLQTPKREEYLLFTKPFRNLENVIVTTNKNLPKINSINDLANKKIAIEKGNKLQKQIADELGIKNIIYVDKIEDTYSKVFDGETDIAIGFGSLNYKLVKEGLPLLLDTGIYTHKTPLRIAINKDIPEALSILQKGLDTISAQKLKELKIKWQLDMSSNNSLNLTLEEKDYLKNNPVLKIGFSNAFEPLLIQYEDTNIRGLLPDIYEIIAEKLGVDIEYKIDKWDNVLNDLSLGNIDLIPTMSKPLAQKNGYLLAEPLLKVYLEIFTNQKNQNQIESLENLKGLKVSYNKNIKILDDFMQNFKNEITLVPVLNSFDVLALLQDQKVDAAIDFNRGRYLISKFDLLDVKPAVRMKELNIDAITAVKKDSEILQSIIQKSIVSIGVEQVNSISKKWLGNDYSDDTQITQKEKQYIQNLGSLNICTRVNHYPLSAEKDGEILGIGGEILKIVAKDLDLKYKVLASTSNDELYRKIDSNTCDLIVTLSHNQKRFKNYNTTNKIFKTHWAAIGNIDSFYLDEFTDFKGHTFFVKESFHKNIIENKYPEMNIKVSSDIDATMKIIQKDKYSHFLNISLVADQQVQQYGVDKFKINGILFKMPIDSSFGVNKEHPLLLSALNKSLGNISSQSIDETIKKYAIKEYTINTTPLYVWFLVGILGIAAVLSLVFLINIKRRNLKIEEQRENIKRVLENTIIDSLNSTFKDNKKEIITNSIKKILYCLIFVFLIVFMSYVVFTKLIEKNNNFGEVINNSGKQRMLSQRLLFEASQYHLGQSNIKKDRYENYLSKITENHEWLKKNIEKEALSYYELKPDLNRKLEDYILIHQEMIKNPSTQTLDKIITEGLEILPILDGAVKLHESNYKKAIDEFERIKLFEILILVLVLFLIWRFLFKPISEYLEDYFEELWLENHKLISGRVITSTTDLKGQITTASLAFCEISGYSINELVGSNHSIVRHPDMPKELYEEMWNQLTNNKSWEGDIKNLRKDGTFYWVHAYISPKYDSNGNKTGYYAIRNDITKQKLLQEKQIELNISQEKLKELNENLENKVKEQTKELLSQNEQLQDKNEELSASEEELRAQQEELIESQHQIEMLAKTKEQFLANMSHEIRTPLNGIVGVVDMLIDEIGDNSSAMLKLNTLRKSSNILTNIVNDILDYSSLQTGNMRLFPKEFSLREMVRHIENTLRNEIESKNLEFNILIDEDVKDIIIADEIRLSQVLLNLLNNSKKFTKEGKILLNIKALKITDENTTLVFEVKDTGVGMSPEIQENLFKPFTKGNQSNTKEFKGTGLGLSIVKTLTELMNGKIDVYSFEKIGTTFKLTINFPYSNDPLVLANKNEIVVLSQTKKALLVEDDKINQFVLKAALEKRNFDVDILDNGFEAINAIKEDNIYDIVFMDIQMPIMDGHEATRKIREFNKQIPIIALSAGVLPENIQKSLDAGMNMHIIKPIVVEEMNEVLNTYLSESAKLTNENEIKLKNKAEEENSINLEFDKAVKTLNQEFGKEMTKFLFDAFIKNLNELNIEEMNLKDLKFIVHKIKGNCGNLKFKILMEKCKDLESFDDELILKGELKKSKFIFDEYEKLCQEFVSK